jgi:hypothetical protein
MKRVWKIVIGALVVVATVVGALIAVGSLMTTHVLTVTRTTTASPAEIWRQWAEVADRTRWDDGLEWARLDGPFEVGSTGEVKLYDQSPTKFEIIECEPGRKYTDRFELPLGGSMTWYHSIAERGGGVRAVTFEVEVTGPTSVVLAPILRNILDEQLPSTVDKLIDVAEAASA